MLRLREETMIEHKLLECELDIESRLATLDSYRRLLRRMYGLWMPLEEQLAAADWPSLGIDFEERRKAHLLVKDLSALGDAGDLTACNCLPNTSSLAKALGVMYVLEGSTLGGQIIARALRGGLQVGPESGGAFYAAYGQEVGPKWRAFGQALDAYAESSGGVSEMVASARETFNIAKAWLCREGT